ncbi:hypothetical protein Q4E93_02900 [Flavitalea sp. BT771]|uniref:hypothetical protein n=1 Tax=Flavitalea sp. BT771 TaxID=3063329 RepID=UPI0026E2D4B8|nr:hypothetical protein [Flavitalea sp. BT771]MDO6429521.1 hypothetical protein [Flavitalea sp. BT771]MDV6218351.1 hypothetical protein [Flavitalea sp. BT771]
MGKDKKKKEPAELPLPPKEPQVSPDKERPSPQNPDELPPVQPDAPPEPPPSEIPSLMYDPSIHHLDDPV